MRVWIDLKLKLWLDCSPCRPQPSALPRVWHHGNPLPDEGHRTGQGDAARLAPWTLHSHHLRQLRGHSAAVCAGELDHHHPVQSAAPLCCRLPEEGAPEGPGPGPRASQGLSTPCAFISRGRHIYTCGRGTLSCTVAANRSLLSAHSALWWEITEMTIRDKNRTKLQLKKLSLLSVWF